LVGVGTPLATAGKNGSGVVMYLTARPGGR
jgi:hypothetical protein